MTDIIPLDQFADAPTQPGQAAPQTAPAGGVVSLQDFAGPPAPPPPPAATQPEQVTRFSHLGPLTDLLNAEAGFKEQFGRAITMGLQDKVGATVPVINKAISDAWNSLTGQSPQTISDVVAGKQPESYSDLYHEELAKERGAGEAYAENHPVASKVATTLGAVASIPATGAAATVSAPTLAGRALQGAGQGAILGATSGFGNSNDESLIKTAADTAIGAGTGTLVGAAAPVVAEKVVQPALDLVARKFGASAVQNQAVRQIADKMKQDASAGGPTAQNMLDLLAAAPGKPQTVADVAGENTRQRLGSIMRQPGEARQFGTQFLNERDAGAGTRLAGDVNSGLSGGPSAFETSQALMDARSQAANPLYQKFDDAGVVHSDRLQQFIDQPEMRSAFAQGVKIQRLEAVAEGRPFDPNAYTLQPGPDGLPVPVGVPNMRTLDAGKKGLDAMIAAERDPMSGRLSQQGVALDKFRRAYLGELDKLNPDYAAARAAWSGPSASLDAVRAGQGIFSKGPDEISAEFSKLSPNDQEFYRLGAADSLKTSIAKTGMGGDEAKRIIGNQYTQDQLKQIFPTQDAYQKFIDSATAENRMFNTRFSLLGGSQTAGRTAEDIGGGHGVAGHAIQAGAAAMEGAPVAATMATVRALGALLKGSGENPAVNSAATRLLLSSDPATQRALLAKVIAGQNAPALSAPLSRPLITGAAQAVPVLLRGYHGQ